MFVGFHRYPVSPPHFPAYRPTRPSSCMPPSPRGPGSGSRRTTRRLTAAGPTVGANHPEVRREPDLPAPGRLPRRPDRRRPAAGRRRTARTEARPTGSMNSRPRGSLCPRQDATAEEDDVEKTTSADGTTIAYDEWGDGPAVVIVGGAFN